MSRGAWGHVLFVLSTEERAQRGWAGEATHWCSNWARCPGVHEYQYALNGEPRTGRRGGAGFYAAQYSYITGRGGHVSHKNATYCVQCAEKFAKNHKIELPALPPELAALVPPPSPPRPKLKKVKCALPWCGTMRQIDGSRSRTLREAETHEEWASDGARAVRLEVGAIICWFHESVEKRLAYLNRDDHWARPGEVRAERERLTALIARLAKPYINPEAARGYDDAIARCGEE